MDGDKVPWIAVIAFAAIITAASAAGNFLYQISKDSVKNPEMTGYEYNPPNPMAEESNDVKNVGYRAMFIDSRLLCIPAECMCFDVIKKEFTAYEHFH